MEPYSPDRRTALVFCGTGAHGAYQAGVLRALQEAGVRLDIIAGQGIGAATAALAAIDGGTQLWDANGIWRGPRAGRLYGWKWPLVVAAWLVLPLAAALLGPPVFLAAGVPLPRFVPLAASVTCAAILLVFAVYMLRERLRAPASRRSVGSWWWKLAGTPFDAGRARELVIDTIWQLIRGAAPLTRPDQAALGRRYTEVLAESLGQPGFRELMIVVHDVDTRMDLVAALLREDFRRDFMARRPGRERQAEALDLAGIGRDHAVDVVAGALCPPLACDPHLTTFGPDSYWRGETHRLVDRPGAVARLLEELDSAGVSQVIVVSAVAKTAGPHRLVSAGLELHRRLGEFVSSAEAAAVRDAIEQTRHRFDRIFVVCPAHNPVGPFDVAGAYDEASDRRQSLTESMERGYEDAYRQFIEPVVGASGEQLAVAGSRGGSEGQAHGEGVLDNTDSPR